MGIPVAELDLPALTVIIHASSDRRPARFARVSAEDGLAQFPLGITLTRREDIVAVLGYQRFHPEVSLVSGTPGGYDGEGITRRGSTIQSAQADMFAVQWFPVIRLDALSDGPVAAVHARAGRAPDCAAGRGEFVHDVRAVSRLRRTNPRSVRESLRHPGAVGATGRYAAEDIEYRGVSASRSRWSNCRRRSAPWPSARPDPLTARVTLQAHGDAPEDLPRCRFAAPLRASTTGDLRRMEVPQQRHRPRIRTVRLSEG